MNGAARLPKYATDHHPAGCRSSPPSLQQLLIPWCHSHASPSASPSSSVVRGLLILLLVAQLLFLGILRLGPTPAPAPSSFPVPKHLLQPLAQSTQQPSLQEGAHHTEDTEASSHGSQEQEPLIKKQNHPVSDASSEDQVSSGNEAYTFSHDTGISSEDRGSSGNHAHTSSRDSGTPSDDQAHTSSHVSGTPSEDQGPSGNQAHTSSHVSDTPSSNRAFTPNHVSGSPSEATRDETCPDGYIFVYNLPPIFNRDIIANCSGLSIWMNVCPTLANGGLGESLGDASPLGQAGSWYVSDQFSSEVIFHNRMLQHPCLTDKPELASGFYVPFYAGLEVGGHLWGGFSAERRDRVPNQLLEWLDGQPHWKRNGGWDHFLMVGRITWDFRRSKDEDWGSGFFYHPSVQNMTRLLIERNPWDDKEMGVPYPTNFHPQSDAHMKSWQAHVRSLHRSHLFSFAGAPRKGFPNDFRTILLEQCDASQGCQALDCSNRTCDNNQRTLELFMDSVFCLQPRGDSFTRRSTFDCLLAGTIPVFFWDRSAYVQYKWHLPADAESYSAFIPKEDIRNGTQIEQVLSSIPEEKVRSMQETVVEMIPKIVYAVSGGSLTEEMDAFDTAIAGLMRRFKELGLGPVRLTG